MSIVLAASMTLNYGGFELEPPAGYVPPNIIERGATAALSCTAFSNEKLASSLTEIMDTSKASTSDSRKSILYEVAVK